MNTDTFKVVLCTSTYTPSAAHDEYADLTNELSTASGYTAGGAAIGTPTWTGSSGTWTWDGANVAWTASGGALVARYAVVYDDTATGKPLVCYILMNNTPADITIPDGTTATITWNGSGIFAVVPA